MKLVCMVATLLLTVAAPAACNAGSTAPGMKEACVADFSKLLDKLYAISGVHTADPGAENYLLVSRAFHHFGDFMFYDTLVPDR